MKITKPKVEIQLNGTAYLTLLKDKALIGENSYGPYFMYSVQEEDTEKVLFATSEIHTRILEAGLMSGDSFELKKVALQNGSKLSSKFELSIIKKNGNGQRNDLPEEDNYRSLMEKSLRDAIEATRNVNSIQWDVDSIRSIALTIFTMHISKKFRHYADKIDLKEFTFHNLRDTYASWLVQQGLNLKIIQQLLGHESISTTLIYAHLAPDNITQAVKILDNLLPSRKNITNMLPFIKKEAQM